MTCSALILAVLTMLFLESCHTSTKIVELERVTRDTLYVSNSRRDSIYVSDSTVTTKEGDTIYIDRWHTVYKEFVSTDTLIHTVRDTIPQIVEIPKPVPYIPAVGKTFIVIGVLSVLLVLVGIAWKFLRYKKPP